VCRFNPIFGQGMSVAAMEAVALGRLLGSRAASDPLEGLATQYLTEIQDCLEAPWATATTDFVYPQTRGERPPDLEKRLQYGAALMRLAAQDAASPLVASVRPGIAGLARRALRQSPLAGRSNRPTRWRIASRTGSPASHSFS